MNCGNWTIVRLGWAAALSVVIFGLVVRAARADSVTLKSGEVIEGDIVSETESEIKIQVWRAHGSIAAARTFLKANVDSVQRDTPEEKAERAFEDLKTLQLDPLRSLPLAAYDSALQGMFARFLERFPDSPHADEVRQRMAAWQDERAHVAAGRVKRRGEWMSADEGAKCDAQDRAEHLLREGGELLDQNKFEAAAAKFREVFSSKTPLPAATLEKARQSQLQTYDGWIKSLEKQQQQLEAALKDAESRLAAVTKVMTEAKAKLAADEAKKADKARQLAEGDGAVIRMGEDFVIMEDKNKITHTKPFLDAAQANVTKLKAATGATAEALNQTKTARDAAVQEMQQIIAALNPQLASASTGTGGTASTGSTAGPGPGGVAPSEGPTPTADSADSGSDEKPREPTFLEKYWMWILGGVSLVVVFKLLGPRRD